MAIRRGPPSRVRDTGAARCCLDPAACGAGEPCAWSRDATSLRRGPDSAFGDPDALSFVLDQMPVGVLLVDGSGRVVWTNRSVRALIRDCNAITLRSGRLVACSARERAELDRIIERAIASDGRGGRAPETIALPRPRGAPSLVAVVSPVARSDRRGGDGIARAVVFLSDPARDLHASRLRLQALFGLTPAESRLVDLLSTGCSLQAAASRLGITNASARTYLKRAFEKTGTRRQGELVRLALAATPAGAQEPGS